MATWFTITYEGDPTEDDYARVAELAAEGFTSGQLINDEDPAARLEYLRGQIRAECISYGELADLQGLAAHIEPGDTELLEAAGVPEFTPDTEDEDPARYAVTIRGHYHDTASPEDGECAICVPGQCSGPQCPGSLL